MASKPFNSGRLPQPKSRSRSDIWSTGGHNIFAIESEVVDGRIILQLHSSVSLNRKATLSLGGSSWYRRPAATILRLDPEEAPIILAALLSAMEEAGWK